jgi:hypothetical protein
MFAFDFDCVRSELQVWSADNVSFSSVALRMMVMTRKPEPL